MTSVFTKIINREIPAHIVSEDEHNIAILDIRPLAKGHTLAIPKKEKDYIFDLTEEEFLRLQKFARKTAMAIEKVVECKRVGLAVLGLEVPHAHIHLVPIQSESDLNFANKRIELTNEEMADLSSHIKEAYRDFA